MGFWFESSCYVFIIFLLCLSLQYHQTNGENQCDLYKGRWVLDQSYPLYNPSVCTFIERVFACQRNGRSDQIYSKFRWQPRDCNLVRFNGRDMLRRLRGKSIMFVGDSLSRNQWQSLTCMLHSSVPNARYNISRVDDVSIFYFKDYGVKVMLDRKVYLVDVVRQKIGRVLKLDSVEGGKLWKEIDMLVFNTWHWWGRRGASQPWDYVQVGQKVMKDMNRMLAFKRALTTWAKWVDENIDPSKTMVFFQGISPSHYNGSDWREPRAKSCVGQSKPVFGSIYPGELPPALSVLKNVLNTMKKPVRLLDITNLSLFRKDGHPSIYGFGGKTIMDCSHWCLSGVPDTWNEILYNLIL